MVTYYIYLRDAQIFVPRIIAAFAGVFLATLFVTKGDSKINFPKILDKRIILLISILIGLYLVIFFPRNMLISKIQSKLLERKFSSTQVEDFKQSFHSEMIGFSFKYPDYLISKEEKNPPTNTETILLINPTNNYTVCSLKSKKKDDRPLFFTAWGSSENVTLGENNWDKYTESTFGDTTWILNNSTIEMVAEAHNLYKGISLCEKIISTITFD